MEKKKLMRGIRPYYNKFRAYVVDDTGVHHQEYFNTIKEAENFILSHRPKAIGNAKYKKRRTSKNKDLPVGLCDTFKTKHLSSGIMRYPCIVATVLINGKAKTKCAQYGNKNTRKEAIAICHSWRLKMLKKIK